MAVPATAPVVSDARPAATGSIPPAASQFETKGGDPQPADSGPPRTQASVESNAAAPVTRAAAEVSGTQPALQPTTPERPAVSSETASGAYWQVMAVKQPDAEVVVRTLRDKGFPASSEPGPNNHVRVLVGPYTDRGSLGKSKDDLDNAGFHPMLKK
jgi:cell division septation protein DedD